jgi:putative sterol carrier protein
MTDATTEFFEQLEARGHEPLLEKARGTVRFDLTDDGRRARWLVEIDKGDVAVSHKNVKADCVVSVDKALFDRIASGRENAMAAALRGQVGIEGDRELLVWFQRLFPAPPRKKS